MENNSYNGDLEQQHQKPLIMNELMQGRELTEKLRNHLDGSSPAGEKLVGMILSSFDKAISMMNNQSKLSGIDIPQSPSAGLITSPNSGTGSPHSDDSSRGDTYKKRKPGLPQWTEKVKVSLESGMEGPLEDGYTWRKYGQKDILGSIYPRGYYRCTYRHAQGCLATKQVQRSSDPSIFNVIYRGRHSCIQQSQLLSNSQLDSKQLSFQSQDQQDDDHSPRSSSPQGVLINFGSAPNNTVKTENMDTTLEPTCSFSFPSTSMGCLKISEKNQASSSESLGNSSSHTFKLRTTSEPAGYLPHHELNKKSDNMEVISAATPAFESPAVGTDFPIDPIHDFLKDYSFGALDDMADLFYH